MGMMGRFTSQIFGQSAHEKRQSFVGTLLPYLPMVIVLVSIVLLALPFYQYTPYQNFYFAAGVTLLFITWLIANLRVLKTEKRKALIQEKRMAILAMTLCYLLGFILLGFYEYKMPKYTIARVEKTLYHVPPQLSKKQLRELGKECNTFGNTLCSHEVFSKIVRLDPRDYTALANLAMAQSHLGYHQFAIENFERALSQGVKAYDVYRFYGLSLLRTDQKEKAIEAFKASLQLHPHQELILKKLKELQNNQ